MFKQVSIFIKLFAHIGVNVVDSPLFSVLVNTEEKPPNSVMLRLRAFAVAELQRPPLVLHV